MDINSNVIKFKLLGSYKCLKENCEGELIKSNRVLLSYPVQFQYKCLLCNTRYLKTDGEYNLHLHFDQQYGGD